MAADPSYTYTDTPVSVELSGRPAQDDASEYENFKKLAGKLLRVPKREVDDAGSSSVPGQGTIGDAPSGD